MVELSLLAKATVLLAAALAATRVAARAPASVRALLLASAFGALLILPAAALIMTPRPLVIPMAAAPGALDSTDVPTSMFDAIAVNRPIGTDAARTVEPGVAIPSPATLLRAAWGIGCLAFLAPLLSALARLRLIRQNSVAWTDGATLVSSAIARAGTTRRVDVVLSAHLTAPMTYGFVRPLIALPMDAPAWTSADIHQALLHELEHVRRHDWLVHVAARATCALYWFHPLAWMAWRRLSLESERACDDAVVCAADGHAYAQQLVTLARRLTAGRPAPLLSMADRSNLAARVHAVLDTRIARGRAGLVPALLIPGVALGVSLLMSPLQATAPDTQATGSTLLSMPTDTDGPAFVAASVRPNSPDDRQRVANWHLPSGRFTGQNHTLRWFISFAYAPQTPLFMEPESMVGGPDWIDRDRFTLEATAGRTVTTAEMQRLVRQVLTERFGLRVHVEPRKGPAYRMVRSREDGRLGPGLRVTDGNCAKPAARGQSSELGTLSEFSCMTMGRLASDLSERLGRPVIDATAFAEVFDASLTAARTPEELAVIYGLAPSAVPAELQSGVSIFTALQEQLGLRLEPTTAAIDVLVIDAARRPSPNDAPETTRPPAADRRVR